MIKVGRPPVLVLWATTVAERLGFDKDEALTLGRAVARAHSQGPDAKPSPNQLEPSPRAQPVGNRPKILLGSNPDMVRWLRDDLRQGEVLEVELMQHTLQILRTSGGFRAIAKTQPIKPETVKRYLGAKFGDEMVRVSTAMTVLAASLPCHELSGRARELYEMLRPKNGLLNPDLIGALAAPEAPAPSPDTAAQPPNKYDGNKAVLLKASRLRKALRQGNRLPRPYNSPQPAPLLDERPLSGDCRGETALSEPDAKRHGLTVPPPSAAPRPVQVTRRHYIGSPGYPSLPVLLFICLMATFFGGAGGCYLAMAVQHRETQAEIRRAVDEALAAARQETPMVAHRDDERAAMPATSSASATSSPRVETATPLSGAATSSPGRSNHVTAAAADGSPLQRLLQRAKEEIEDQRLDLPKGDNALETLQALAAEWPDSTEVGQLREQLRRKFLSLWLNSIATKQWDKREHYLAVLKSLGGDVAPIPPGYAEPALLDATR